MAEAQPMLELNLVTALFLFDGKEVSSAAEVKKILRSLKVGDTVPMVVDRDGHEVELQIDLQGNTSIN